MMNSLLAKFKPGIEMFETETLLTAAFPSNEPPPITLIGVFNVSASIFVQPLMALISIGGIAKVSGGFKFATGDVAIF